MKRKKKRRKKRTRGLVASGEARPSPNWAWRWTIKEKIIHHSGALVDPQWWLRGTDGGGILQSQTVGNRLLVI